MTCMKCKHQRMAHAIMVNGAVELLCDSCKPVCHECGCNDADEYKTAIVNNNGVRIYCKSCSEKKGLA